MEPILDNRGKIPEANRGKDAILTKKLSAIPPVFKGSRSWFCHGCLRGSWKGGRQEEIGDSGEKFKGRSAMWDSCRAAAKQPLKTLEGLGGDGAASGVMLWGDAPRSRPANSCHKIGKAGIPGLIGAENGRPAQLPPF